MDEKELSNLTDRQLLIKTYGKVERIEGILGNGSGVLRDVRILQETAVTKGEMNRRITLASFIVGALIPAAALITKLAKLW